jgi:hypothetical protein
LPFFCVFPTDILRNSIIALPSVTPFVLDHLSLFNISEKQLLVSRRRRFFAMNYYTGYGDQHMCSQVVGAHVQAAREFLRQRLQLPLVEPHRFVVFNRNSLKRRVSNMREFVAMCKEHWPQFGWELLPSALSVVTAAQFFNEVRFFFAVHGAALGNMIYMQENTTAVELQTDGNTPNFINLAFAARIHYFVAVDDGISYTSWFASRMNIQLALQLVQRAIDETISNIR